MGPNPQAGPPLVSGDYFPSRLVSGEYLADSTLGLLSGDNASFVMILHAKSPTEDDTCAQTGALFPPPFEISHLRTSFARGFFLCPDVP